MSLSNILHENMFGTDWMNKDNWPNMLNEFKNKWGDDPANWDEKARKWLTVVYLPTHKDINYKTKFITFDIKYNEKDKLKKLAKSQGIFLKWDNMGKRWYTNVSVNTLIPKELKEKILFENVVIN